MAICLVPTVDLFDDAVGIGGPDEGFGFAIVLAEIAVDRRLQVDERAEDAALQAPPGQRGEKAFDGIGPGARGRGEVEGPARMPGEPGAHFGMLVDGIIVEDRVDQLSGRHRGLDPVQKAEEFLVAMARHALADDRAVENVERREQGGRAIADVIVRHRAGAAALHRQAGLGTVKGLNLRFLVNRQHQAMRRRVEIEPDHVAQFGGKSRVLRQLEAPHPVRLQTVRRPDALHRAQRDTARRRHRPAGPVGCLTRRLSEGQFDDPVDQR